MTDVAMALMILRMVAAAVKLAIWAVNHIHKGGRLECIDVVTSSKAPKFLVWCVEDKGVSAADAWKKFKAGQLGALDKICITDRDGTLAWFARQDDVDEFLLVEVEDVDDLDKLLDLIKV